MHGVRKWAVLVGVLAGGAAAAAEWYAYPGYAGPAYSDFTVTSQYLTMRDGTDIAVDVVLPKGLAPGAKIPALFHLTRFWRAPEVRWPASLLYKPDDEHLFYVYHGYAMVLVDVRGTGASFGWRLYPWHADERGDYAEIAEWVAEQPWSNGRVGAVGKGYEATAGEYLAATGRPEVKAVVSRYNEFDAFTESAFPGGVFNDHFVKNWARVNASVDRNEVPADIGKFKQLLAKGVRPVDGAANQLSAAVAAHAKNEDLYQNALVTDYRDTVVRSEKGAGSIDDFSLHAYREAIDAANVPLMVWGGWYDASSALGVVRRFNTLEVPMVAVIGPWNKGGGQNASPFAANAAPVPSIEAQRLAALCFLDAHLAGKATGLPEQNTLHYYVMGAEAWRSTTQWPPPHRTATWYCAAQRTLSADAPSGEGGEDSYAVDFSATTGAENRWNTHLLDAEVHYPDRAAAAAKLLTYTSAPLDAPMDIVGHPGVTLHMAVDAEDAAVFAYLEAVAPDGTVRLITEGMLRLLHRAEQAAGAAWEPRVYRSFKTADGQEAVPGDVTTVRFDLLPTAVRVPAGHRIRLSLAGHDADTFKRYPERGPVTWRVLRTPAQPSALELPIAAAP